MELQTFTDYSALSEAAAHYIITTVLQNPKAVFCLATGDTPKLTYNIVTYRAIQENIDFSKCIFIGLDEWMGVPPSVEGSCSQFLYHYVFEPLQIKSSQIHLFNALSHHSEQECEKMNAFIKKSGGIDVMVVGVGVNGHIGFNEPGVSLDFYAHVIDLDKTTIAGSNKYFTQPVIITQGITLGLQHVMETKLVILMANGQKKAAVIKNIMDQEIGNHLPATVLRNHSNSKILIDKEAAALLSN
jgi:glucosamine-6-phosphate isomerase